MCICMLIHIIQSGLYFLFFLLLLFLMFDKISYACWISRNFSWAACFRVGSFVLSGWNSRDRDLHLVVISCWDAPLERPSTCEHIRWIIKLQSSHSNVCHTRNPPTHISSKYITLGASVAEDSLSHMPLLNAVMYLLGSQYKLYHSAASTCSRMCKILLNTVPSYSHIPYKHFVLHEGQIDQQVVSIFHTSRGAEHNSRYHVVTVWNQSTKEK